MRKYIKPNISIRTFDHAITAKLSDPAIAAYAEWLEKNNAKSVNNVTIKRVEAYTFN